MCEQDRSSSLRARSTNQGAADDIAPPQFPAVADPFLTVALAGVADELGIDRHVGVVASTDTFFEGQERSASSANQRLLRRLRGMIDEYHDLGVLSFEMEAGTLFKMGAVYGFAAGCVLAIIAERTEAEQIHHHVKDAAVERAIAVAIAGADAWSKTSRTTSTSLIGTDQEAVRAVALPLSVRIVMERGLAGSSSTSSVSLPLSDCTSTR